MGPFHCVTINLIHNPLPVPNIYYASISLFLKIGIRETESWGLCECNLLIPIPETLMSGDFTVLKILNYLIDYYEGGITAGRDTQLPLRTINVSERKNLAKCLNAIFKTNKAFWYQNQLYKLQSVDNEITVNWDDSKYRLMKQ